MVGRFKALRSVWYQLIRLDVPYRSHLLPLNYQWYRKIRPVSIWAVRYGMRQIGGQYVMEITFSPLGSTNMNGTGSSSRRTGRMRAAPDASSPGTQW